MIAGGGRWGGGGWPGVARGRKEVDIAERRGQQYSWLALYVSHKLAGMLPLSDSLTEHTLLPLKRFVAWRILFSKIKVYKVAFVWVSAMSELGVHEKRIPNGRRRESRGWRHIWGGEKDRYTTDRERGWKTKERKVGTTCWNNVRVFDLKHVTEPHWNQIRGARTLNWLGVRSLLREYLNFLDVEKAIRFSQFRLLWYNKCSADNVAKWILYSGVFGYSQ